MSFIQGNNYIQSFLGLCTINPANVFLLHFYNPPTKAKKNSYFNCFDNSGKRSQSPKTPFNFYV
jgi:hypothetical protein